LSNVERTLVGLQLRSAKTHAVPSGE
jgi:hypothetical protein